MRPEGLPDPSTNPIFQQTAEQIGGSAETTPTAETAKPVDAEMTKTDGTKMNRTFTQNPEIREGMGVRGSGFDQKVSSFMSLPEASENKFHAKLANDGSGLKVADKIFKGKAEELLDSQGREISAEEIIKDKKISAEEILKKEV